MFALFFSQAAQWQHYAQVAHTVCPEHGDWLDGPRHAESASGPHAPDAARDQLASIATNHSENHDHCLQLNSRREEFSALSPAPSSTPQPALDATGPQACVRHFCVNLFRLAPKQSPPAV